MLGFRRASLVLGAVAALLMSAWAMADDRELTGVVVGRTGELLNISVPQPVREGTVFKVRIVYTEPAIAEARVLSCTKESPFIALARVDRGGITSPVPTGAFAYADVSSVSAEAPKPMVVRSEGLGPRLSIQTGAFRPSSAKLRSESADYWQTYRLNYSLLTAGRFDALLSGEYSRASGDVVLTSGAARRKTEVTPVTLMGRIRPLQIGGARLFLGAGGGMYRVRTVDTANGLSASNTVDKFGQEYAVGLEFSRGWVMELRYRDVEDTDIEGYALTLGARF